MVRSFSMSIVLSAFILFGPAFGNPIPEKVGQDVTEGFVVPEGLSVTLWAASPQLFNPTNIDVDARGRIWVAEAVNYRTWDGRNPGKRHEKGDRILILEDTDGDGRCDSSKVFAQDRNLVSPVGIAVLGKRVVVSCSPSVIVYTDEDGDDRADHREIFLTGFGGRDHDHSVHAIVFGPDGRWYFNVGNAGPHIVTDKAGWTLAAGSLYTGGTPYNVRNQPGLVSDDGRVWVGGVALRIKPDGTGLAVIGHNFRNSYEIAPDSFGNVWQSDNDDTVSCRTTWLMEGGNCGFASADGERSWQADRRPGQSTPVAHWRQEDPGVIPSGDITGAGAPTGVAVYEGERLGKRFSRMVLNCDAGRNVVWGHVPTPTGAGYELKRTIFLSSDREATENEHYQWNKTDTDVRKWFRPSDVAVGLNGEVYVADWYDPIVGGHAMHDKNATGRIYRIAPKGATTQPVRFDLRSTAGQLAALKSPAVNVRREGWSRLRDQGIKVMGVLKKLAEDPNPIYRARAIWLLAQIGKDGLREVERFLTDGDADIRITAYRALRQFKYHVMEAAGKLVKDKSPAVRREVALSLRDVPLDRCKELLLQLAAGYDGKDRWYLEAFGTACDGKEESIYPELLTALGDHPLKWSDAMAGIAWRLHPRSSVEAFSVRALTPSLSYKMRRRAVDALAFVGDRNAAMAMVDIVLRGPADTREQAQWWIDQKRPSDWKEYDVFAPLEMADLDPNDAAYASDPVKKGAVDIDVDITGARKIILVVSPTDDGNSYDWADWSEPRLVGAAGELRLTKLKWQYASAEWGKVHVNKNAGGKPMKLNGKPIAYGLGTHARSVISYNVPEGTYTRFRARGVADDGGAGRKDAKTSIEFLVFVEREKENKDKHVAMAAKVRDEHLPTAERIELAKTLAADAKGGRMLIGMASRNELDEGVKSAVAEAIFRNPDLGVRALASEHFERPGTENGSVLAISELVKMNGDAGRGRKLFFSDEVGCGKCHQFGAAGGQVGPELTQIRTKYDKPALLDAILNPSAAVLVGYEAWILQTTQGEILTGFLLADGPTVVLKDTEGRQHVFEKKEIAFRKKQKLSLMPDNIATGLDAQQIADLAAFLLEKTKSD